MSITRLRFSTVVIVARKIIIRWNLHILLYRLGGDQLITYGVNRFHLRDSQARQIIDEVQVAVANWREEFIQLGVVEDDIEFLNKVIEPRLK